VHKWKSISRTDASYEDEISPMENAGSRRGIWDEATKAGDVTSSQRTLWRNIQEFV
jgi:hypothetical protein